MYRIPSFWKRFNRMVTVSDLITGRKVTVKTTDDEGVHHVSIEVPAKPLVMAFDSTDKKMLTSMFKRGNMAEFNRNLTQTESDGSTPSTPEETV